ncbi:MAG: hypothetical protein KC457_31490 [Myxococcales bacterium]|nr:hypothetical protein [Myxococcales bacterium]
MRGSRYLGIREHVATTVPGGVEALLEALPTGALRDFCAQRFAAKEWYDALPIRPITELVAKLEGRAWEDSIRARAQDFARLELGLLRRLKMKLSSPEKVVEQLERAALDNFNFGESEIVEIGPGRSQVVFHEVPQPLGSWFLPTMAGYAGVLIERAGGKKPVVNGRLIPKGQRDAIGLVDVRVNLTWV